MITVGDVQSDWRKCNPIKKLKVNGDGKKHRSVPEVFLTASLLVASAYGRSCVSLRPTSPTAREKNFWYPGYLTTRIEFSARSILDSTVSCDVTERYTPRTPRQNCQIKYGGPFVRLLHLQPKVAENPSFEQEEFLCACHSEKQSFGFVKKDPRDQVFFNLSGL